MISSTKLLFALPAFTISTVQVVPRSQLILRIHFFQVCTAFSILPIGMHSVNDVIWLHFNHCWRFPHGKKSSHEEKQLP